MWLSTGLSTHFEVFVKILHIGGLPSYTFIFSDFKIKFKNKPWEPPLSTRLVSHHLKIDTDLELCFATFQHLAMPGSQRGILPLTLIVFQVFHRPVKMAQKNSSSDLVKNINLQCGETKKAVG